MSQNEAEGRERGDFRPLLTLYGTAGCHLCEEAEELLRPALAGEDFERVDIELEPALMERYGVRIPVLLNRESGKELGWPFDGEMLAGFLRQHVD